MSNFIGYANAEEFVKHLDPGRTVHCAKIVESFGPAAGSVFGRALFSVVCSQIDLAGDVHYLMLATGEIQQFQGGAVEEQKERLTQERSVKVYSIVKDWLQDKGFDRLSNSLVATPDDMKVLRGSASFLGYDKEKEEFYRKNGDGAESSPEAEAAAGV